MIHTDTTIVGVFADRTMADKATGELTRAGFRCEPAETIAPPGTGPSADPVPPRLRASGGASVGALIGIIVGALFGGVIGTGLVGGIGPFHANVALAGVIGAVIGLVVLGILGALIGWGVEGNASNFYVRDLHAGRVGVRIHADGRLNEAVEILRRNGADVQETQVGPGPAGRA